MQGLRYDKFEHPRIAAMVFALDARLRERQRIFEFSSNPACILRARMTISENEFTFKDGSRIVPGQTMLELHLWNENLPRLTKGPLAWSAAVKEGFLLSLTELRRFLDSRPDLDVAAIRAEVGLATESQFVPIARLLERVGFEYQVAGSPSLDQQIARLGHNVLISLMVFARNSCALRSDSLRRARFVFLMSRKVLDLKFAARR